MKRFLGFLLLSSALSAQAALTIGAYNIRNFDYDERARIKTNEPELANIIKSMRADIMSVEEVVNKAEFESFITKQMPGYAVKVSDCGGTHNQHLGFIYNTSVVQLLSFNEDLSITEPGTSGSCNGGARPLAIGLFQVKATGQKFYGMTAHLKSGSDPQSMGIRMKQFPILQKIISELRTKSGIKDFYVAGDMNTTEYLNRGSDYKALTQVVSALGMVDLMANTACSAYWWGGSD